MAAAHPNPTSESQSSPQKTFTIGTRKSKLALVQTDQVVEALKEVYPQYDFKIHSQETAGDRNTTKALKDFTSKNLWTEELEELLMKGEVDLIVNSLKDVPTLIPSFCTLGPMMEREDSRDVLVMKSSLPPCKLSDLAPGSVVGTSSIRRTAQIARRYPHLKVIDVRGNIGTRLAKLDAEDSPYTCIIIAAAGLHRLGLSERITEYLDSKNGGMLYAVGQGGLGVEMRKDDKVVEEMLNRVAHKETTLACLAERSLLRTLEGGCSAPLGVETEWVKVAEDGAAAAAKALLRMRAVVVSVDGAESAQVEVDGSVDSTQEAEEFGVKVAHALVEKGAGKILEEIQRNKGITSQ